MIKPFLRQFLKFRLWVTEVLKPREVQVTLFWAGIVGVTGGLLSVMFRKGIDAFQYLFTHHHGTVVEVAASLPNWERLLIPTIGGLLAGLIIMSGTRLAPGQSSTDFMEAVVLRDGVIRTRSTLIKSISSLFSIASGGSIGREGPMVQLSAMFASLLGRRMKFSVPRLRLLVACGGAAGIAAAYNAPIAGALFIGEIVLGSISMESFGPLIFSSVIATVTVRDLLQSGPVFKVPSFALISNVELFFYVGLGLMCGFLSPFFLRIITNSEEMFSKIRTPLPIRLALGGLIVGGLSIISPEVWGNGYSVVDSVLRNQWVWDGLFMILLIKITATAATVGSGAVGGVFTPTLFVGAILGCLFGQVVHELFPNWTAAPNAYALVGMGCFLSGTTHAPLMAILMLFEMTLDYQIVLPLMLGCVTSYYTAQSLEKKSIYSESLVRKSPPPFKKDVSDLKVSDLIREKALSVGESSSFGEIAEAFARNRYNYIYVVGGANEFRGAISLHDIKEYLNHPQLGHLAIASDLMHVVFPTVVPENKLSEALQKFSKHDGERMPVVSSDARKELLGYISKTDLLLTLAHGEKNVGQGINAKEQH